MRISKRRLIEVLNGTSPEKVLCNVMVEIIPVLQPSDFEEILRRCPFDNGKVARIVRKSFEAEFLSGIPAVKIGPQRKS